MKIIFCDTNKELVQQELAKRKAIQKIKEYIANEGIELADPMKDSEWWSIHWDKNNEKFIIRYYDFVLHFSPIGYFKTNVDVKKVIKNFTPELKTIWGIK